MEYGEPFLCLSGNTIYLALAARSSGSDLTYAAIMDLERFYRSVAGDELTKDYALMLYDRGTDLFLHNMAPDILRLSEEDALSRGGALSALVRSEETGDILSETYRREADDREYLISVIPSALTDNGSFALGVSLDNSLFLGRLERMFFKALLCTAVILAGIAGLLVISARSRRINRRYREEVALLKERQQALTELSHHQRLETIGIMTSGVAYELGNLLSPIMGYSLMAM